MSEDLSDDQIRLLVLARHNVRFGFETNLRPVPLLNVVGACMLPPRGDAEYKTVSDSDPNLMLKVANVIMRLNRYPNLFDRVRTLFLELPETENASNPLEDELFLPVFRMPENLFTEMLDFIVHQSSAVDLNQFKLCLAGFGVNRCSTNIWLLLNLVFRLVVSPGRSVSLMLVHYCRRIMPDARDYCQPGITAAEIFVYFNIQAHASPELCALLCADVSERV
jgi:hypothetical protein